MKFKMFYPRGILKGSMREWLNGSKLSPIMRASHPKKKIKWISNFPKGNNNCMMKRKKILLNRHMFIQKKVIDPKPQKIKQKRWSSLQQCHMIK